MLLSCSQYPALGASSNKPSQTSVYASLKSQNVPLKPRSGFIPAFFSLSPGFAFSPLEAASYGHQRHCGVVVSSLKPPSGKGFGKKNAVEKKKNPAEFSEATGSSQSPAKEDVTVKFQNEREEEGDDVIPEVVTNRMLKRIGLTVGVPLAFGLLLFPLFYYLKAVNRVDVPEWLPLVVSMFTFGTAGFGITYGVVSSSWDPAREGSVLGWKEAQVNWPLIWNKVRIGDKKK